MRQPVPPSLPTIASVVRGRHPDWSWNQCREVITRGRVKVDGSVVIDPTARIETNVALEILNHGIQRTTPLPQLHVYFHDQHIIVVEKESGIESVPFSTKERQESSSRSGKMPHKPAETLIDMARKWIEIKERKKIPPLRIVHRIDKGTSGIVVFARTPLAERELGLQFRAHSIKRHYLAVVVGTPTSGVIRSALIPDRGDGYRGSTRFADQGKDAVTYMTVLTSSRNYSLVKCRLETGRTHQIRIHMCESGHPLCGDAVYRRPRVGGDVILDKSGAPRLLLHAAELGFKHPTTSEFMHFESPLKPDFESVWVKLI